MNWDEDIDLLAGKKEKPSMKHGRRSSNTRTPGSPEEIPGSAESLTISPPEVPVRTRKTGGWADEGTKLKLKGSNSIEQERFESTSPRDADDDIPIIPDIDDIQDDNVNSLDIKVPTVTVKQSTYKELDNEFERSGKPNFGSLGDIDLSVLTSRLYPEKEVQKCTEIWTMESLYHDLAKQS